MTGLLQSVFRALLRRWNRNLLTISAMVVGAGALVSVLAISQSSAQNLANTVDQLQSDTVLATLPHQSWDQTETDLVQRVVRIGGVERAGTFITSNAGTYPVDVSVPAQETVTRVATVVATPEGCRARGVRVLAGGFPDDGLQLTNSVLIGVALAKQVGVSTEIGSNTLIINGMIASVTGIVRDNNTESDANTAVILPPATAAHFNVLPQDRTLQVVASSGAVATVARAIPVVAYPTSPEGVSIGTQPSPERLRDQLLVGSRSLVLTVSAVMVGATLFGIVTTMQIAVWERRRELGIARAMGETRLAIGLRFLLESMGLGFAGGLFGYMLGVIVSAGIAHVNAWPFVLPPQTVGVIFLSGAVGAVAGSIPAWNASRVSPGSLLRSD